MTVATSVRQSLVTCSDLSVVYGDGDVAVTALDDVDLKIREGEYLGLLGPSGSGKTTLLHVLGGLVSASSGAVHWRGNPLRSFDQMAREGDVTGVVAYVFQGSNLLPTLDAQQNIAFAIRAAHGEPHHGTRNGSGSPRTPVDFLALVGLAGKAEALPSELSGGEQQRVAVARALAQRPELMMCDEPTGQLDFDTGKRVLDLIDAAREMFNFTLVVATHDRAVGARADRTVELADGRLSRDT
jgi:putative ABC transport system ATP-binding protein